MKLYPRSADAHLSDSVDFVGKVEMAALTQRSMGSCYKWLEGRKLPYADGPLIEGKPTWRRETFLAWAEANGFAQDADGADLPIRPEARAAFHRLPRERYRRAIEVEQ